MTFAVSAAPAHTSGPGYIGLLVIGDVFCGIRYFLATSGANIRPRLQGSVSTAESRTNRC